MYSNNFNIILILFLISAKKLQRIKKSERALQFVCNEEGSIPRSSIQFKLETKYGSRHVPFLSKDVEINFVQFIIELSARGFPQKKEDIKTSVQDYLKKQPYDSKNPLVNIRPGDGWYFKFLQRHRNALKNVEDFESGKEDITKLWFKKIGDFIIMNDLSDVIQDPNRVFILDETIFNVCSKTGNVYGEGGYNAEVERAKEKMTVTFSFAANGAHCNPMIIYPYRKVPDAISDSIPVGWGFGRNETGHMTSQILYEYILNVFVIKLKEDNIDFPVIIFVDGYKTHITFEVHDLCKRLQIHLIAIYRSYNHILSPYGVSLLRPVKSAWEKGMGELYAEKKNSAAANKLTFAPFLQKILDSHVNAVDLIQGFMESGLYPFKVDNIIGNDNKSLTDQSQSSVDDANDRNDYLYFSE